jgi:hypothetical protein
VKVQRWPLLPPESFRKGRCECHRPVAPTADRYPARQMQVQSVGRSLLLHKRIWQGNRGHRQPVCQPPGQPASARSTVLIGVEWIGRPQSLRPVEASRRVRTVRATASLYLVSDTQIRQLLYFRFFFFFLLPFFFLGLLDV